MLLSPMSVTNANSPTTGKITPTTTTKICLHPYTRNTEYAVLPIKRNLVDMNVLRSLNRKIRRSARMKKEDVKIKPSTE
jgi:hypothetical protein